VLYQIAEPLCLWSDSLSGSRAIVIGTYLTMHPLLRHARRYSGQSPNWLSSGISLLCLPLLIVTIISLCLQPVVSVIEERGKSVRLIAVFVHCTVVCIVASVVSALVVFIFTV